MSDRMRFIPQGLRALPEYRAVKVWYIENLSYIPIILRENYDMYPQGIRFSRWETIGLKIKATVYKGAVIIGYVIKPIAKAEHTVTLEAFA